MSFLKTLFFMIPLAAVASIAIAYIFTMQWIQPRYDEAIHKLEVTTNASVEATKQLQQAIEKLDKGMGQ